jgi:hypothetical protein
MNATKSINTPFGLRRPSLEFRYTFDYCAMHAYQRRAASALLVSSPLYAYEMLHRLYNFNATLIPTADWWATKDESFLSSLGMDTPPIQSLEGQTDMVKTVIWAAPQADDVESILASIHKILDPDGKLYIIAGGTLSRFLEGVLHFDDQAVGLPVNYRQLIQSLKHHQYHIETIQGFHGLISIIWSYAFRLMNALGKPHLADRCFYRMRATYAVDGWQKALTTLNVIVANKPT